MSIWICVRILQLCLLGSMLRSGEHSCLLLRGSSLKFLSHIRAAPAANGLAGRESLPASPFCLKSRSSLGNQRAHPLSASQVIGYAVQCIGSHSASALCQLAGSSLTARPAALPSLHCPLMQLQPSLSAEQVLSPLLHVSPCILSMQPSLLAGCRLRLLP